MKIFNLSGKNSRGQSIVWYKVPQSEVEKKVKSFANYHQIQITFIYQVYGRGFNNSYYCSYNAKYNNFTYPSGQRTQTFY